MSKPMHLTINPNPCKVHLQVSKESQKDTFKEHDTVTLQCSTSAHCQSYPEWHGSSSAEISESTREDKDEGQEKVSELQLKVTWMDDGRTLSCRPPGSTDDCQATKVTLAVEYAPKETKITVSSEDVKEGETVTLYCSSKAHPNASYMWFKNNILSQSTEEYTLNDVKPEDSGEYRCQASNYHGKEDSTVMINVKYAPKGVQVEVEPSDVKKGDEVRLTCSVQKSNPDVLQYSYRWYKDNKELQEHSNELYIPNVTPSDNGWYHCQARNDIGSTDSTPTVISVKYAPEDTSIQGPSEIKLGSALRLSCFSNASPEADHYSWYYKSEDMLEYVVLSHTTQEFRIEKVAVGDSGCGSETKQKQNKQAELFYFSPAADHFVNHERMCPVWKLLLLLVTLCLHSSLTTPQEYVTITVETVTREEGSCITINCRYRAQEDMQQLWFKDPKWNETEKKFNGIIVYSNTEDRPQSPEYSNRVEYQGVYERLHSASCTLRINHLQMSDSGNYSFRYIKGTTKFMSKPMHLTINPNPCKVHLQVSKESQKDTFKEHDTVTLQCSTSAHCQSYPEWHGSSSAEISESTRDDKDEGQEKVSELHLKVTWMDDGRTLSCRPPGSTDDCQATKVTLAVEYAPKETKITVSPEDVKEGETVTLYCSSKAHPNASYMWFKNNILSQSTEEYTLNDVKPEDSGEYRCQASNYHGKVDSTVMINVKYAPKGVQVEVEPSDVKKGDEVRLTCSVQKSNPDVLQYSYRWHKDNKELQEHSNELYIPSVTPRDSGWYHCKARNNIGSTASTPTVISVKYAPEDTSIQGPSEIKLGSALRLSCFSNASPEADHYSWYYKSEDMLEYVVLSHTTQEFWIEKVAVGDSRWYMCSSRNVIGAGSNSTAFRVHILYPPRRLNLSMADVVRETELLNIYCTVESYPEAKITLSRTSHTLEKRVVIVSESYNKLTFSGNVSESYAGEYTCTAENSEGKNYTKQQLKVLYAPKDVKASVHPSEGLKEGTELTLKCEAHSEPSVSKYSWEKSFGTATKTIGREQKLTVRSLNVSDAGNYFCTASNDLGTNQSASVQIRVKYRPHITIIHNLTSMGLWDGKAPVQLTCKADCYPPATTYKWYRKDDNTEKLVASDQNYTVQPQDPGIYFCYASNEIGESTSEPAELFGFFHQILLQILISTFIICILIGVIILVHRIFMRKRSSDGAVSQSRFFAVIPARSSRVSNFLLGSWNNTRENLMMADEMDSWRNSGNQSATTTHTDSSTNRHNLAERPVVNIHTVYDAIKLPQTIQDGHHKQKDSTTSAVNYANLQIKDPTKSVCSSDGGGAVYAVVSKNKQKTKVMQGDNEDYENISGANAARPDFSNIIWDSSSSEEEEELNYTHVTVTGTPQHKPQHTGGDSSSDEEDRTEYSQVKM
ncbi:basement membrane-specific heparan sulfate proteoglycan core protein [Colossoma macropomum]|uniref:basement membrane-specific heparan sulfate proteoglycan core protein n=1 Tax=Colossoma macropomum TaxID=42526 RepID=UPI001863DADA|nr:basement membrane-specific heparan sulfate proteoglycan core protein [Colossoma macropomum]